MDDHQFGRLLDFLRLSREGYRRVRRGVKKRVSRHMLELQCRSMDQYLRMLEQNPRLRQEAERLVTVPISRFFRDRDLWQSLENDTLPRLISREAERDRVWSAGCARGEEIYSFMMLWDNLKARHHTLPELEAWATDMNPVVLDQAQEGIYHISSLKEVPGELRGRHFRRIGKEPLFAVSDSLKQGIIWKVHNLLSDDPPQTGFHLVFLRNNLLTYYGEARMKPALLKVIHSLAPGGFLIVGAREKLPEAIT